MSPMLGGPEVTQGLSYLASVGRGLKSIASRFNMAVIVTNHLVSPLQEGGVGESGGHELAKDRPALGLTWASFPHVRVKLATLRKPEGDLIKGTSTDSETDEVKVHASLLKHTRLPCGKTKLFSL